MSSTLTLNALGWQPFFQQQMSLEDWDSLIPARVVQQHKTMVEVESEQGRATLQTQPQTPPVIVGDWVLLDEQKEIRRVLERKSCFRRKAAGHQVTEQLVAANVDTAFIVCSLNEDFNLNRIERYLSLANEAKVEPVVVLSKMDLCDNASSLRDQVQKMDPLLNVVAINGLDHSSVVALQQWCPLGNTVVLLGSSGSGKSTLTNTLLGEAVQATGAIRENDAKGRHTTTRRSLLAMPGAALILDTPGMRELQLTNCEAGVASTFSEIEELALRCKFGDCQHESEPGCAVQNAIADGSLEPRRLSNYSKLMREQAMNTASMMQRRSADKNLGKFYKRTQRDAKKLKGK